MFAPSGDLQRPITVWVSSLPPHTTTAKSARRVSFVARCPIAREKSVDAHVDRPNRLVRRDPGHTPSVSCDARAFWGPPAAVTGPRVVSFFCIRIGCRAQRELSYDVAPFTLACPTQQHTNKGSARALGRCEAPPCVFARVVSRSALSAQRESTQPPEISSRGFARHRGNVRTHRPSLRALTRPGVAC